MAQAKTLDAIPGAGEALTLAPDHPASVEIGEYFPFCKSTAAPSAERVPPALPRPSVQRTTG